MVLTLLQNPSYFFCFIYPLKMAFKQLWERTKDERELCVDIPDRANVHSRDEWKETTCKEIAEKFRLPSKGELTKMTNVTTQLSEFAAFYFLGSVPAGKSCLDIILGMAAQAYMPGMTTLTGLVWSEEFYETSDVKSTLAPFSTTSPSTSNATLSEEEMKLVNEIDVVSTKALTDILGQEADAVKKLKLAVELGTKLNEEAMFKQAAMASASFINPFDQDQAKEFYRSILLAMKRARTTVTPELMQIVRVFNYIALTMLRAVVKNKGQLISAFSKVQYAKNIATMIPGEISKKYVPPSTGCIDHVVLYLTKTDPQVCSFIAKVVYRWSACSPTERALEAILSATLLTHTAWNGMGIIEMILEISIEYNIRWTRILESSIITETEESWTKIIKILLAYQKKERPDKTVSWARVVDDSYFGDYAIGRHRNLAALLIESLKDVQGSEGVQSSVWAIKNVDTIAYYRDGSIYLRNKLKGMGGVTQGLLPESEGLAQNIHVRQEENPRNNEESSDSDNQYQEMELNIT